MVIVSVVVIVGLYNKVCTRLSKKYRDVCGKIHVLVPMRYEER